MHAQPLAARPERHTKLHRTGGQPAAGATDEHRPGEVGRRRGTQQERAFREPSAQRLDGKPADRQHPRLGALAEHPHGSIGQIQGGQIEPDELRQP